MKKYILLLNLVFILLSCKEENISSDAPIIPEIYGISKETTFYGDIITVYGKDFGEPTSASSLHFHNENNPKDTIIWISSLDCIDWTHTAITFIIENKLVSGNVEVCNEGFTSNQVYLKIKIVPDFHLQTIPAGEFTIGSEFGYQNERPTKTIAISNNFEISETEITQELWQSVMRYNNSTFQGDKLPVHNIQWIEAVKFCNELSKLLKLDTVYQIINDLNVIWIENSNGYRLPTEAEWEYACKGNTTNDFNGSDNPDDIAWYAENSAFLIHPVAEKLPNQFGLYDMHGNAWEWCWDWYDSTYYDYIISDSPKGPSTGETHTLRGGSIKSGSAIIRSSNRTFDENDYKTCGFRIVK